MAALLDSSTIEESESDGKNAKIQTKIATNFKNKNFLVKRSKVKKISN
jgi:hypothetical protein